MTSDEVASLSGVKQRLESCVQRLRDRVLTESDLQDVISSLDSVCRGTQNLLYLQASDTSPFSPVVGMFMIMDGEEVEIPRESEQWPYQNVIEAVRDGWRVIQFPNMALMLDESQTYALGCDFILERWS